MRATWLVIALLVGLVGLVWLGQGTGLIGGSVMSGEALWAFVGAGLVAIGVVIATREWRRRPGR